MSERGITTGTETRVQQHFKNDTNVSHIVEKFQRTGILPTNNTEPQFIDHTQIGDYTEMLAQVTEVQQSFQKFPSKIRAFFHNDPKRFVEFIDNPKNQDKAIELGIIKPLPKPDAQRAGAPKPEPTPEPTPKTTSAPEAIKYTLDEALTIIKAKMDGKG